MAFVIADVVAGEVVRRANIFSLSLSLSLSRFLPQVIHSPENR